MRSHSQACNFQKDIQEVESLRVRGKAKLFATVQNGRSLETPGTHLLADKHSLLHGSSHRLLTFSTLRLSYAKPTTTFSSTRLNCLKTQEPMFTQTLLFKEWPLVPPFQVNIAESLLSFVVREVAVFGSAYFGIVKALRDKLEEDIQQKVSELAAEG